MQTLIEYAKLHQRAEELKRELKEIEEKMTEIENRLIEEWAETGQSSATVNDVTFYIAKQHSVTRKPGVSMEELCKELQCVGAAHLIYQAYNAMSLRRWVLDNLDSLPPNIQDKIEIKEFFKLCHRRR